MKKTQRRITSPRKPKRKAKWGRIITASALTIGVIAGVSTGVKKIIEKNISDNDIIYTEDNFEKINNIISSDFDDFKEFSYIANEPFDIYVENKNTNEIINIDTIKENQELNVYKMCTKQDYLKNEYYYCEVPDLHEIGLIRVDDLNKATKLSIKDANFNQMYKINSENQGSIEIQANIGILGMKSGFEVKPGEIIFADMLNAKIDQENNVWLKMRNNFGNVGYIKVDDSIQRIDDGVLVEITSDSNNILNVNNANLSTNSENMITNIEPGDRLVVISQGSSEKTSYAVYFDDNGNAKWGEINNELLKEVELESEQDKLSVTEKVNDVEGLNKNISNWLQDYQNGAYGIDISASMTGERFRKIPTRFYRY